MKCVGLAPNPHKAEAIELATKLADWLIQQEIAVRLIDEVASQAGHGELAASDEEVAGTDLLVVLGGDGTMLRWSRLAAPLGTPMMGVNFGQYGFITEIAPENAIDAILRFMAGDYSISERVVLQATLRRDEKIIGTYHALNDVVVSKGPLARMIALDIKMGGKYLVTYMADGIIVSSPTGSTAYSLSAGGPVVHPDVSVLLITPICPHTLTARSLVVSDSEIVQIAAQNTGQEPSMMLTIDGQHGEELINGDLVEVCTAAFGAKLVLMEPMSFYNKLQTRLRWGERFNE